MRLEHVRYLQKVFFFSGYISEVLLLSSLTVCFWNLCTGDSTEKHWLQQSMPMKRRAFKEGGLKEPGPPTILKGMKTVYLCI